MVKDISGIAGRNTLARYVWTGIVTIGSRTISACFLNWVREIAKLALGEVIAVDGKSLNGSIAPTLPFATWQAQGYDLHSRVADPKLKSLDVRHFDWMLADDAPALALGFKPIDLNDVGPRLRGNGNPVD